MKRLVIRLSVLTVVIALGMIAIAQTRHGFDRSITAQAEPNTALDAPLPERGQKGSIHVAPPVSVSVASGSSRAPTVAQGSVLKGRVAGDRAELDERDPPEFSERAARPTPAAANAYLGDEIPPASVALAGPDRVVPAGGSEPAAGERYAAVRASDNRYGDRRPAPAIEDEPPLEDTRAAASPAGTLPPAFNPPAELRPSPQGRGPTPAEIEEPLEAGRASLRDEGGDASRYSRGTRALEARPNLAVPDPQEHSNFAVPGGDAQLPSTASEGIGRPGAAQLEGKQSPALTVEKHAPKEIQVGKPCRFEIIVRNVGQVPARDVEIHDEIPQGTTLINTTPQATRSSGGELVWALGTIEPGSESKVDIHLMPVAEGQIGSVASVRFQAEASASTTSTKPELALRLSAPPKVMIGESVRIDIEVSNQGSGAATGVILMEDIPELMKHPAGNSLEFEVGTLAPGESRKMELLLTAAQAGNVSNMLVAHADANLEVRESVEFEVVAPGLTVSVDGPQRRYLERQATYTFEVGNPGTAPAKNVELTTYLPQGMKFVSANNAGRYNPESHSVVWGLDELPPKQSGSVELVALPVEAGELEFRVEGKAQQGLSHEAKQVVSVEGLAAILFEVADVNDPIEVGGETTYEIHVLNQGSKASSNVRVVVLLPADMTAISATGPTRHAIEAGRVVFSPLARLAPKADTTYRVKVQASGPGDQRVSVQLFTDEMTTPVTKEESTRVYSDQ